jgi:thymidylate kinase
MKELHITIEGSQGAGKTRVAEKLGAILHRDGFTVSIDDGEDQSRYEVEENEPIGMAWITTEQLGRSV